MRQAQPRGWRSPISGGNAQVTTRRYEAEQMECLWRELQSLIA